MIGLRLKVPEASWYKSVEKYGTTVVSTTYLVPPPSTCYGCALALVGEWDLDAHFGVRVAGGVTRFPRQVIRAQSRNHKRMEQTLLSVDTIMWIDSSEEEGPETLEYRLGLLTKGGPLLGEHLPAGGSLGRAANRIERLSVLPASFNEPHFLFVRKNSGINVDTMPLTMSRWYGRQGASPIKELAAGVVSQVRGVPSAGLLHRIE